MRRHMVAAELCLAEKKPGRRENTALFNQCNTHHSPPMPSLVFFFWRARCPPFPPPAASRFSWDHQSEMVALFKVDTAYGEVMASADGQLKSWRQSVGSGKVVSDFGERVSVR